MHQWLTLLISSRDQTRSPDPSAMRASSALRESFWLLQESSYGEKDPPRTVHLLTCDSSFYLARTTFVTEMRNSELMVAPSTVQKILRATSIANITMVS